MKKTIILAFFVTAFFCSFLPSSASAVYYKISRVGVTGTWDYYLWESAGVYAGSDGISLNNCTGQYSLIPIPSGSLSGSYWTWYKYKWQRDKYSDDGVLLFTDFIEGGHNYSTGNPSMETTGTCEPILPPTCDYPQGILPGTTDQCGPCPESGDQGYDQTYSLYQNKCVPDCPTGTIAYMVSKTSSHAECVPECSEPAFNSNFDGQCITCGEGLHESQGECVPDCVLPATENILGVCECPSGQHFKLDGTCTADCVEPYLQNQEGVCVPPTCSEDKHFDGVECVRRCGPYQHWDSSIPGCVSGCPPDYYWDTPQNSCIPNIYCDPGETSVDGWCIPDPEETCPFGTKNVDGDCIPITVNCPSGSTWSEALKKCIPVSFDVTKKVETVDDVETGGDTVTTTWTTSNTGETSSSTTSTMTGTAVFDSNGNQVGETSYKYTPSPVEMYEKPKREIDTSKLQAQVDRLVSHGPVNFFRQIKENVGMFNVEPKTPAFSAVIGGHTMKFDLHAFDDIASVFRFLLKVLLIIGLGYFIYRMWGLQ